MKLFIYSSCMILTGAELMWAAMTGDWSVLLNVVMMWGGYVCYAYLNREEQRRKQSRRMGVSQ